MDILAYFLPGFHEDKFNSEWWGEGFTEWNNVEHAKPLFCGHAQPNPPLSGFYNLLDSHVLEENFILACSYGIDSFIVYDYWYEGQRPLGGILDLLLKNKDIKFKFSLCWANHSWTRSWKNRSGAMDVLIEQTYCTGDELDAQVDFYTRVFSDHRYYQVYGRPLFQIYRPQDIPNLNEFLQALGGSCKKNGIPMPFVVASYSGYSNYIDILNKVDALVLANPTLGLFLSDNIFNPKGKTVIDKVMDVRNYPFFLRRHLYKIQDYFPEKFHNYDYRDIIDRIFIQSDAAYKVCGEKVLFSTFCGFDNTPRYRQRAKIVTNSNADDFLLSLKKLYKINPSAPYICVNAWNEWGEGMALEPSLRDGNSFLKSIREFKMGLTYE